jgi:fluoroquinolone transport system permease protein
MRIRVVRTLGAIDRINIGRDPLLRGLIVMPLVIALVVRWAMPPLLSRLEVLLGTALLPHFEPVVGYALLTLVPILAGALIGFLLLDQRDDGTLTALRVTPLPLAGYLGYRLAVPMLLSVVLTLAIFPAARMTGLGPAALLVLSAGAAPFAPVFALFVGSFAANKVQGFALMKASNLVLIVPLVAYFMPSRWELALGVVPTYWPAKAYWLLLSGDAAAWLYLAVGIVYQAALIVLLLRRLSRVMSR